MMKFKLIVVATTFALAGATAQAKDRGQPLFDFSTIDADGNGEITQAEITAFEANRFAQADENGDGLLSQDEILASFEAMSDRTLGERATRRIGRMMSRIDANDDGLISLEERQATNRSTRLFERLDRDDSGTISEAEAEKLTDRSRRHRGGKKGDGRPARPLGNDRS